MNKLTGGCLCGAVRYKLNGAPKPSVSCHCQIASMCGRCANARHTEGEKITQAGAGWGACNAGKQREAGVGLHHLELGGSRGSGRI